MAKSEFQGVPIAPLTGVLDARSDPRAMPANSLRLRQNLQTVAENKLRRGTGWQKFLSLSSNYNNSDFHDQLLSISSALSTETEIRQPITFGMTVENTRGVRTAIIATQRTIAKLNEYSGSWQVLGSGYGGAASTSAAAPRFHGAALGDYVILTNDFDPPMYHELEHGTIDNPITYLKEFADLGVIGLTRAAHVWVWHNVVFFADVEMDGERFGYRIVWGDYDNPTSFDPAKVDSIAGYKDLFSNEKILGGRPLGNSFLIYTTKGIWEMVVVGGDMSFDFVRRYNGEDNEGCGVLKYPNTLVSLPDSHLYMAEDGVYSYSPFMLKPERIEWLHRATPLIYDDLDATNCQVHVAHAGKTEVLFSTASTDATNACPDRTLRIQLDYKVCDYVDHGFTCLFSYQSYSVPKIRDFIVENGICTLDGLIDQLNNPIYSLDPTGPTLEGPYVNENLPRTLPTEPAAVSYVYSDQQFPNPAPDSSPFYDSTYRVEDFSAASAVSGSLCDVLDGETLDDTCRKCETPTLTVACSSTDWCLKQLGTVFYRERCANPTAVGSQHADGYGYIASVGSYILDGYSSLLRFAPMFSNGEGNPFVMNNGLDLYFKAAAQDTPGTISLRVGIGGEPEDPNDASSNIVWHQRSSKTLTASTARTPAEHAAVNSMPNETLGWVYYHKGRVLYLELTIGGTGSDTVLAGVKSTVRLDEASNF